MAAGINPYLPVDPAAEGKPEGMKSLIIFFSFLYTHIYSISCLHLIVKADSTLKPSEEVESGTALGPDLTASVETTYSEQSSSSAGSSSSSDQPIYFRYIKIYSVFSEQIRSIIWFRDMHCVWSGTLAFVFSLLLESSASPQKFPYGWTTKGNMWPLNR